MLWGWVGEPLTEPEIAGLARLADALDGDLREQLRGLVSDEEVATASRRLARLRGITEIWIRCNSICSNANRSTSTTASGV